MDSGSAQWGTTGLPQDVRVVSGSLLPLLHRVRGELEAGAEGRREGPLDARASCGAASSSVLRAKRACMTTQG